LTAIAPKTSARCNSAELHWAAGLVGKPYRSGARGPDAFDCWGIVQFGWQQRLGLNVPDVRLRSAAMFRSVMRGGHVAVDDVEAVEVDAPAELDAVYMTSRQHPHHVGLWIAPDALGGVLHAIEGAGVVFQRRADLIAHGIAIVKFMRLKI